MVYFRPLKHLSLRVKNRKVAKLNGEESHKYILDKRYKLLNRQSAHLMYRYSQGDTLPNISVKSSSVLVNVDH